MKSYLAMSVYGSNVTLLLLFFLLYIIITWDGLYDLVPFVQFKNGKNTHERVLP